MAAAETIENSFGQYMYSYRIGGDEFCVFLEGINIQAIYEKACNDFIKLISIKNKQLPPEFELQIAKGFEIYDINNKIKLNDTIKNADKKMYENKQKQKNFLAIE